MMMPPFSSPSCCSNLERFLQCVTPLVPSRTLPQRCINDINSLWQPIGKERIEYFTLKDVWESYNEWSAYGAGTNVMLEDGDTVMQFYVPYLSSIHIYTNKSPVEPFRNRREDAAKEGVEIMESGSWSDDDDDSTGSDNLSRSLSNNSSKGWDEAYEDSIINSHEEQEGSWNARERLGHLYLEYTEMCSPYQRVPLVEKIMELARRYPALMTLKSVDLSPASWMAVAWYPIYSIPSRKNERGLETCFLTYHTLSSSFQDCATVYDDMDIGKETSGCCWEILAEKCERRKKMNNNSECMMLSMPPFGVATYKMRQDIWVNAESFDHERLSFLYSAAESWLKQLHLHHHHDFNFFTFHSSSSYSS